MMMDMEVMHSGQQNMDLIDILWKQDIDLGARREVFDYNHRQKENELQRQQELEEEKRLHLLREQEKALLAQLQLDEETGEYIPRPPTSAPMQSVTPLEVSENISFTEGNSDALSFDECLQLLAETFPVEESENTSLDTTAVSASSGSNSSSNSVMMSPEQPILPAVTVSPGPQPAQRMSSDLEQAWLELLSLPELQQCLSMQMEDTLETTTYPLPNSPVLQNPDFPFYSMSSLTEGEQNSVTASPPDFINTFDGSVPVMAPPDNHSHIKAKDPQLNTNFRDIFYPDSILQESNDQNDLEEDEQSITAEAQNKSLFTPMELISLSPGEALDRGRQILTAEVIDSDSGISANTSPNASSPGKSVYGDGSFGYSDSDMEEMDQNPGSAESDYSELFSLNFQPDDFQQVLQVPAPGQPQDLDDQSPEDHKTELAEENGHNTSPFTKDKRKKSSDVRLSRDEQRAKALKIPFTVDMIINLPVDDFNEMMSKHQLNEAQLALVRDIRRRGKNKVAAQNCRKRKMENIIGLESDLDSLKDEKERLLGEKTQNVTKLKEMKQQLNTLYLEVFSMLRDEKGNSYSPSDYSLQQSTDGNIFLVPRTKKTFIKRENTHVSPM